MITDLNCAVYEMRCNKYPTIEIADALHISDEDVELVDKANQEYVAKLEMIRLGRLSLSDFS
ncbi:hypothetical protein LBO01_18120 [Companilactobacillus paralimentarius]|uniref:Uncharacterized protein n=2 Tax=Companilactobacillus bobalius TaxID=2801451 RepID=A0A202F445_9LACO|nr:hypothetical protein ATN92_07710 [Companilactobacillus bobalius]OVE95262.1 hypothetical protein LKACC16343_02646 [Companilactobacillus bobalius]GEO58683.1 hypothetical protein LBO01_18120 [Companilactobacillus paralimentarius]